MVSLSPLEHFVPAGDRSDTVTYALHMVGYRASLEGTAGPRVVSLCPCPRLRPSFPHLSFALFGVRHSRPVTLGDGKGGLIGLRRALVLLTPVSRRPNARRGSEGFAVSGVRARPPAAYSMGRPVCGLWCGC